MLYNAKTPEEYLKMLDSDWRKDKVLELRAMILATDTKITEGISYKMLEFSYDNSPVFNLNAQSAYVSLYVGNISKVPNYKALLAPFNIGKGCIRIRKTLNIKETHLNQFIKHAVDMVKVGKDIGC